jgi:filamentous hemagglutinin family protein
MLFAVAPRRSTRRALLTGASLSALAVGWATPAAAAAPRMFSQAWFAARVDASTSASAAPGSAAATLNQVSTTNRNLATLARQLQAQQAAQAAAASAGAAAPGNVPNGLVLGGLQAAAGALPGSALWTGAGAPSQAQAGGRTQVTVQQTAPQAMLTWQTFNVGSKTDLTFNQSAGGMNAGNWVVLNRVEDPAANPTQILGSITATGKVFIINANGIVFGAGSQVNLGALIASTADISAAQFASGIYGAQASDGKSFDPSFTGATADSFVLVDQGAAITTTTPISATAAGGYVMLLGGAVTNNGEITTPSGQTVLAAGEDFILQPGYSTTGNQTATVQGSQVASCFPATAGVCAPLPQGTIGGLGDAANNGLITSTLGDITLVGHDVTQAGVIMSTTSVNTRGTVHLLSGTDDTSSHVVLAPGSVTSIEPDGAATTALDSQRATLIAQSTVGGLPHTIDSSGAPELNDVGTLPDLLDESRIEIVTGGFVQFDDTSLTLAQGGQIAVQAGYRVWAGSGAALDVSGSTAAVLPIASDALVVNIQGNELRDAPVNRDTGALSSTNVSLDIRDLVQVPAGTDGDTSARDYTAGGLLEVSGYLSNLGHTIDEWDALAGTITLAGNSVVSQPGADFNIAGGSVSVQGGELAQSYLIGPDGQLFNANTAPGNIQYSGVYNGFSVTNTRFGTDQTYTNSLVAPAEIEQAGYTYGRDAGSVVVDTPSAVLEGTIEGGVANGVDQIAARPATVTDGYTLSQDTVAQPGTLSIAGFTAAGVPIDTEVAVSGDYTPIASTISPGAPLPVGSRGLVQLSAAQLSAEQLGGFDVLAGTGTIDVSGPIDLAPGGTISLAGGTVQIGGDLSARGGRITLDDVTTINGVRTPLLPNLARAGGVFVSQGVTLDLRGEFTNAALGASNLAGEALVNGGTLAIDSFRGLSLAAGSVIDASSGGALLAGNAQKAGAGGSVTLIGDDPSQQGITPARAPIALAETLRDAGVNGGGTLTLTLPSIMVAGQGGSVPDGVLLDPATFQTGFSDYVIDGYNGLTIASDTQVVVAEPVYTFYTAASSTPIDVPTGADPAAVFQLILLPTFQTDQATARLTQRKGASVAFLSNDRPGVGDAGGGAIDIAPGAAITVDPGQSVRIEAYGQITDDGTITAPGGTVALVNEQQNRLSARNPFIDARALSVFIGSDAAIDVAGVAVTASDTFGRSYGIVTAGGTITLGADPIDDSAGDPLATDANVIVAGGAELDADGADATIDLLAGTTPQLSERQLGAIPTDPVDDATAGGTINLRSYASIDVIGAITAAAGGAGAAGGTLAMVLEDPIFQSSAGGAVTVPDALRTPRVLTISQNAQSPLDGVALTPGAVLPLDAYGTAAISQQQIAAGGFDTLSLYARDLLSFQGDVALRLAGAVSLNQGIITDTSAKGVVSITAPYVLINGEYNPQSGTPPTQIAIGVNASGWKLYQNATKASFTVDAALIDVANAARFGVTESYAVPALGIKPAAIKTISQPGFAQITLASSGDIRFLPGTPPAGSITAPDTLLTTPGDVTLQGAQVYPATGARATVFAGVDIYSTAQDQFTKRGSITILGDGSTPAVPYSVGGSLSLYAGVVTQDGVLRAPEGDLVVGDVGNPNAVPLLTDSDYTYQVQVMPGSVTSVSLDGMTIPYGGTVDGVTYDYDGQPVSDSFDPAISLQGRMISVPSGALLDLSGGGTLSGAGFVTGRGGSVDTLTSPFLSFNATADSVASPTLTQDPIYAIVPGYTSDYAPITPVETSGSAGSVPALGAQITIGAGVPGIAPGTYTLLPSYYALLPGAARVQIDQGSMATVPGVTALGAGSYALDAATSVANTGVAAALPVEVIVTTEAGVLLNSDYNQDSFSQFQLAEAAKFGTPRGTLPEDGKTLNLVFPAVGSTVSALDFAGTTQFAAQDGFYAGQATVGGQGAGSAAQLEITADGADPTKGFVSVDASALDALEAPSLIVGGIDQRDPSVSNEIQLVGTAAQVAIRDGATLAAPQIFLTAESNGASTAPGAITIETGATLTTIGQGAPPFDTATSGLYYNTNGYTVIALSNGQLTFAPSGAGQQTADGAITVESGATLLTAGTLNFLTTQSLTLSDTATYGAQSLALSVGTINIASDTALAEQAAGTLVLPSGLVLTQALLTQLLGGDSATGVPALQQLVLSANQSVNFAGTVTLDARSLQSFVLNTPAIYGYGTAGDVASIQSATGTITWNGIETGAGTSAAASALPGGVVANGPGTGAGTLDITAANIVLGYGPNTQPDDQTTLNRLVEGFATVDLTATDSLSANDRGTLSVYQTQGASYGDPGSMGNLTITTPLLTGAAGSVDGITAGGALTLVAPAGGGSTATSGALGAEVDLAAASIADATTILLNAGRLTLTAATGVSLGAGARIDLAGQAVTLVDQTEYAGGGSLVVTTAAGGVTTDAASSIDVAATQAAAGSVAITALAGAADLAGAISGGAAAGQTSGSFTLAAETIGGFDPLNTLLDTGAVFGARSFEQATGALMVDQTVQAHSVSITADSGALTIAATATIDAAGPTPGSIALAGGAGLTVASGAVLTAQGTVLQADSTGAPIAAENQATVSLTAAAGTLTLGDATIDVGSADPTLLGQVILNAPRLVTNGAETGAVAISAAGPIAITGAANIILYASRTYTADSPDGTISQLGRTNFPGAVTAIQLNADNTSFMRAAAANTDLAADTTGLAPYAAYQLRPADIIQSSAQSGGNLTVDGDLNLVTGRYDAPAGSAPGAGIAGLLTLRAANTLTINGSITDGFETPPDAAAPTPDDNGWTLYQNEPLGQNVILPTDLAKPVVLANGTRFSTASALSLSYPISVGKNTEVAAGGLIAGPVTTAKTYTVPAGGLTLTAAILNPDGSVFAARGTVLAAGTPIPAGVMLQGGTVLPFAVTLAAGSVWAAGANLALLTTNGAQTVTLDDPSGSIVLAGGQLIPGGSTLKFGDKRATSEPLRPVVDGVQGLIYATATLLPQGSESWSINLVGGADLASANLLAVEPIAALAPLTASPGGDPAGSIVLADTHYTVPNAQNITASYSVIRTGTGTLNLVAGGNIDEASLYGIYTAGTQTQLGGGQDAAFNTPRATGRDGTILGAKYAAYNAIDATQQASYADGGGNVLVSAGGDVLGDVVVNNGGSGVPTDSVGDWLWTQGGAGIGQSTAWWVNFGSYVISTAGLGASEPVLTGFTGIGALGGGNVTVQAGGDAGEVAGANNAGDAGISQSLVVAVASTGRVTAVDDTGGAITGGATDLTGGGVLTVDVAGTLNPTAQTSQAHGGALTDTRGDIDVQAGQLGTIALDYTTTNNTDPRAQSPFTAQYANSANGLVVLPGDGSVTIDTMRDLVLAGAGDPTRQVEEARTSVAAAYLPSDAKAGTYAGETGFSLWTPTTAIDLFSAGGNITPTTAVVDAPGSLFNDAATDDRFIYPATLQAVAASGSFFYGANGAGIANSDQLESLELAPSPSGELSFIAAQSIYGHGYAVDMSGADNGLNALPNPYDPSYTDQAGNAFATGAVTNFLDQAGNVGLPQALFGFEADTPTSDLHAGDAVPERIYAATGDLVDVQAGEVLTYTLLANETVATWYLAAKPADIFAGRDIVSNGTLPASYPVGYAAGTFSIYPNEATGPASDASSGDLLLNQSATDVSTVSAGRDILGSYFYIAGPGQLEVTAGRNIDQTADSSGKSSLAFGVIKSVGPVFDITSASRTGGASIAVLDGAGSTGADDTAFANLYFNNANQADLALPLSNPANQGKVQQTYQDQLYAWLQTNYGYTGNEAGALAAYFLLPAATQSIFVNSVFFDELLASGRQEVDPASLFYKSFDRGDTAIATLFPTPSAYAGSITLDSGTIAGIDSNAATNTLATFDAGISTLNGGDIQILTPGGADTFGSTGGPVPGASSGVITQGSGNIAIYALGSVLLGQSRVFTTFGGNIQIWSQTGDINAGRGSKTTLIVPPPVIAYDPFGGITLSPPVPTTGAGIATLAPIAGIAPGSIDLVAPIGTVDAGEAGIRSSGALNVAAAIFANGGDAFAGGPKTGNAATASVNTAAASAAANAAGASTNAATNTAVQRAAAEAVPPQPSIITVEILGGSNDDLRRRRPAA